MTKSLRVGVIGASAQRGWAKISHVPAIQQLEGLELGAVVTQDQPSADEAARMFGAAKGYGDPRELFADPAIDIVTVAVKVPDHRELVLSALAAGKHVYCEYPLGRDAAEAQDLAAAARAAGVHTAIGLQTRANPAARRAAQLIAEGAVGRVLSARILSTTMAFGPQVERAMAFGEDAANGVTLATIQAAHTLDFATALLGDITSLSALASTQFPRVQVEGAGERARTTPDHLLVAATLASGSPLSIEVAGGRPPEHTPFLCEVVGETGMLRLEGGAARGFQSGVLSLSLNGEPQPLAAAEVTEPDTAVNVAGLYAALRDDIATGAHEAPGFDLSVRVQQLVALVLEAGRDGARRRVQPA